MSTRLVLRHAGRPFLIRRGVEVRWCGIYVHRITAADPGMDLHDHPWPFISVILRGGYREVIADVRSPHSTRERTWRRWSTHRMPLTLAHRIIDVEPNTVTLVVRTRKSRVWGFYTPGGWVRWDEYDYDSRRPVTEARWEGV